MATQSVLSSVNIKGRNQVKALVNALEKAEASRGKKVEMSRSVFEVKGEDKVKDFLTKLG